MAIFAIALSARSAVLIQTTKILNQRVFSYNLAKAGINYAINLLLREDKNVDHLKEEWAAEISQEMDGGKFVVNIVDEERKINLNQLALIVPVPGLDFSSDVLGRIIGVENTEIISGILDYIDLDSLKWGEANDENLNLYMTGKDKKANLFQLDEILFITGVTKAMLESVREAFTIYNSGEISANLATINANTIEIKNSDCQILTRLGASDTLKADLISRRNQNDAIDLTNLQIVSGTADDKIIGMLKSVSNFFLITSQGKVNNVDSYFEIRAIFDRGSNKILFWNEDYRSQNKATLSEEIN